MVVGLKDGRDLDFYCIISRVAVVNKRLDWSIVVKAIGKIDSYFIRVYCNYYFSQNYCEEKMIFGAGIDGWE